MRYITSAEFHLILHSAILNFVIEKQIHCNIVLKKKKHYCVVEDWNLLSISLYISFLQDFPVTLVIGSS